MYDVRNLTLDELQARFRTVLIEIRLLSWAWNNPKLTGSDVLRMNTATMYFGAITDPEFWAGVREICNGSTVGAHLPEVKQFIHNFCTNLCAEKLLLVDEIKRRALQ